MLQAENPSKLNADAYAEFLAKFETKKTTDDCYTPPAVYQAVVDYVDEYIISLKDKTVARPFYPNGNYEAEAADYDENIIVIDNPPFSILTGIRAFYAKHNIKYFLFCPALTAFSSYSRVKSSYVIPNSTIVYKNGAKIATAFVTNLLGDVAIKGCPILAQKLKIAQQENGRTLPKYTYSDNVVTAAGIQSIVGNGGSIEIRHDEVAFTRQLDAQKSSKKSIFGAGFLVDDDVAERIKAERIKAERIKAERIKRRDNTYYWKLSEREKNLTKNRNQAPAQQELGLWAD